MLLERVILTAVAYDEKLAERLRDHLEGQPGIAERKMFGGLAFLVNGHMAVAVSGQDGLLLRCPPGQTDELCGRPHAARFVMKGRELTGWLHIEPGGLVADEELAGWIAVGLDYARGLAPK
jgi:TfoX N-terminal domain